MRLKKDVYPTTFFFPCKAKRCMRLKKEMYIQLPIKNIYAMLMEVKISNVCNDKIRFLKELENDAKDKSEWELRDKYRDGLDLIHIAPTIINNPITLYRSRLVTDVKEEEDKTLPSTFSYVPLSYNAMNIPKRGRMNLSGQSFFYASFSPDTNYKEIKKDIAAGDEVYLSKWEISANSVFSIYKIVSEENISESADTNTCICITDPNTVNGPIGKYLKTLSDIILKKEDNEDREYLVSSLISNDILVNMNGKSCRGRDDEDIPIHYDAIVYPSTQFDDGAINHYNLVITPQFIDQRASLKSVVKGVIKEDLQSIKYKNIGFNINGKIEWYEPYIYMKDVNIEISFITKDKVIFDYEDAIVRDRDGKIVSESALRNYLKETIIEGCIKENFLAESVSYGTNMNKDFSIEREMPPIIWETDGWTLERNSQCHDIALINIEKMTYKNVFKEVTPPL